MSSTIFLAGVAQQPHRCQSASVTRIVGIQLDNAAGGRAVASPVSAIRLDRGDSLAIGYIQRDRLCERLEPNVDSALRRVAELAETNKIFLDHCAALGLGDDVTAVIRFPRSARDASGERGHDVGFDRGGDGGFLAHDSGPFLGYTQDITRDAGGCKRIIRSCFVPTHSIGGADPAGHGIGKDFACTAERNRVS